MFPDEDTTQRLRLLEKEFITFNQHTNLVSKNDEKIFFEKHIKDSLLIENFFTKYKFKSGAKLLDIGTGGGLPALPVAIAYPEINVYAIDSIGKKIKFIQEFKEKYQIENIFPIAERIENLPAEMRSGFDFATSRALARLNVLLEYAIPFLKPGGFLIAYKAKTTQEEIDEAQKALKVLNAKVLEVIDCSGNNDYVRNLIVIKKIKECEKMYPRKQGLVKKYPLI